MPPAPRELTDSLPLASDIVSRFHATPLTTPIEAVAFWTAVCLPVTYLPLLFLGERRTVAGLLALHVIALALGHGHKRDIEDD